jgi:hypothetical protein
LFGISVSICAWPLGQTTIEGELISVGPALDAFVVAILFAVALLLVQPAVGLIAIVVLPVAYLAVPRWQAAKSEVSVTQDFVLGAIPGFRFRNRRTDSSVGVWLLLDRRLTKLLASQGVVTEQSS